jgi:hypothetical protein
VCVCVVGRGGGVMGVVRCVGCLCMGGLTASSSSGILVKAGASWCEGWHWPAQAALLAGRLWV